MIVIQSIYDQRQLSTVLVDWSGINHKTTEHYFTVSVNPKTFLGFWNNTKSRDTAPLFSHESVTYV